MKSFWSTFVTYFIRGLVFITPMAVTILLISYFFNWVKGILHSDVVSPSLAILLLALIVIGIAFIGYVGTSYLWKPVATFLENWVKKVPIVNTVYTSTKDVVTSFLGDKKKFDKPVLVLVDRANSIERLGFVTQGSLEMLGLEDRVAVYCPISYSMAGDLIVVKPEQITALDKSSSEMMKFLISGGLAEPNSQKRKV